MRPARTAPSKAYSTASIRRAARSTRSSNRRRSNSIMISCAAAGPHRHLQSFLLRRMSGDAGASGTPRQGEDPAQADYQRHLARAVRGYLRVRALPHAQRHDHPEVLPQRVEGGATRAVSRAAGRAIKKLEILDG